MTTALKAGVNYFDNAEVYANGQAETVMGNVVHRWLDEGLCFRSDLVIATKIYWSRGDLVGIVGSPNVIGLSRKHIVEGLDASLKRLRLPYVDVVFAHRPDGKTPLEETVRAFNHVIDQGKAFYWGTSEWSAREITEAHGIAQRLGLVGPLCEQPQYNMLHRFRFEKEYQPCYAAYGTGTTIWSPLASGILAGKYNKASNAGDLAAAGDGKPKNRLDHPENAWLKEQFESGQGLNGLEMKDPNQVLATVDKLKPVAARLGCTLAQLALAWCVKNPHVSTVITGASRPEQVTENMGALKVADELLTAAVMAELDEVLGNVPNSYYTDRDWGRGPSARRDAVGLA